jgi:UDP-perosamine 4-acetyltransferase
MSKQIYLLGGGGHGRVVLDALLSTGASVVGILDPALHSETLRFGISVLGDDDYLLRLKQADVLLVNGVGANPNTRPRADLYSSLCARGFLFEPVCHAAATIGHDCRRDNGSQVMAGAVLQPGVILGENAVVNTSGSIDHDCSIGAHCFVGPGAVLCGNVTVEMNVFIGAGAVVSPGVRIGEDAIVGAGAVVMDDVAESSILVGNPARRIGTNR